MTQSSLKEVSRLEALWDSKIRFTVNDMKEVLVSDYNTFGSRMWTKCIVGVSGIGKTWLCKQVAEKLGIGFESLVGSGLAAEDIRGFPMPVRKLPHNGYKADELAKVMADYYTTEPIYKFQLLETLARVFSPGWKGILLLDEWAQAPKEVQDVFFQIVYDRRMDDKRLSDDVMILSAMNPPYMSEYMLSKLSSAAEDRLEFYVIDASAEEWIVWGKGAGIDTKIIDFISEHPAVFDVEKGRRLHNLSDKLSKYSFDSEYNVDEDKKNLKVTQRVPPLLRKEIHSILRVNSAELFVKHLMSKCTFAN